MSEFAPRPAATHTRVRFDGFQGPRGLGGDQRFTGAAVIALAATLYKQLGPALRKALAPGLSKSVMDDLDAAFEAAGYDAAAGGAVPKRAIKSAAAAAQAEGGAAAALNAAVQRGDLGTLVSEALLSSMDTHGGMKDAWKKRQAALISVEGILDANPCVEANSGAHELVAALAKRLADSNQNLKVRALPWWSWR